MASLREAHLYRWKRVRHKYVYVNCVELCAHACVLEYVCEYAFMCVHYMHCIYLSVCVHVCEVIVLVMLFCCLIVLIVSSVCRSISNIKLTVINLVAVMEEPIIMLFQ